MERLMQYHDPVYGSVTLTEPVLLAVMNSKAMQRLHGVLQHGITALIGVTQPITRFDHSLGAMLLVRRLGGSEKEQLAALLHDVSHTAFSHVIDHVYGSPDQQSYHDRMKGPYIAGTNLPATLEKHGYNWQDFLEEQNFPLLERPAPALCADRLDYSLRDSLDLGLASPKQVAWLLSHLTTRHNLIVVDDQPAARWLADIYLAADDASWANFDEVGWYELAARAIQRGMAIGAMSQKDIWGTDAVVWAKLHAFPDDKLQHWLGLVSPNNHFVWDEANPTFRIRTKIRTIDPDVLLPNGVVRPLSTLDEAFATQRQAYIERKSGVWPMRLVKAGE